MCPPLAAAITIPVRSAAPPNPLWCSRNSPALIVAVDSAPAIRGGRRAARRRWAVAIPPTPARKPTDSSANRPITGHSEAS